MAYNVEILLVYCCTVFAKFAKSADVATYLSTYNMINVQKKAKRFDSS